MLIELIDDLPGDLSRNHLTFVDHHGAAAGQDRPTAIEQVFALLDFPAELWTNDLALVAANDRGHIEGLRRAARRPTRSVTFANAIVGRKESARRQSDSASRPPGRPPSDSAAG